MLVKVPGTTFVRDTKTMALINVDNAGLEDYNFKKQLLGNQKEEINNIKNEINEVKDDIKAIKQMLLQLSSRK
jgi:archaellum component FlaC